MSHQRFSPGSINTGSGWPPLSFGSDIKQQFSSGLGEGGSNSNPGLGSIGPGSSVSLDAHFGLTHKSPTGKIVSKLWVSRVVLTAFPFSTIRKGAARMSGSKGGCVSSSSVLAGPSVSRPSGVVLLSDTFFD